MHIELVGPEHPEVANAQLNLAMVLYDLGELASAFETAEESLALYRKGR